MITPSAVVKDIIEKKNIAEFGKTMFIGKMPETPVDSVCLYDYYLNSDRDYNPKYAYNNCYVQVKVRGVNYTSVYDKTTEIDKAIASHDDVKVNGNVYGGFYQQSGVNTLMEGNLTLAIVSYRIVMQLSTNDAGNRVSIL